MRKIFILPALLLLGYTEMLAQIRQWDKPMQLKSCSIDIKADLFTATTFIEMEFYNPNNLPIEGLHQFELKSGQVITAFQLDLNGKYRDGSIEEKWKATNAYNTIVGKRVDPALLTMDYADHYSLRIFPVPAKGTRRITMTIQQLLTVDKEKLLYSLPLKIQDTVQNFLLKITVQGSETIPFTRAGLIAAKSFRKGALHHELNWEEKKILLKTPLAFYIPLAHYTFYCTKKTEQQIHFALQLQPSFIREYEVNPKDITVFWDASGSSAKRDIGREINFLRQFIAYHKIRQLTIIPFSYKILGKEVFNPGNNNNAWKQYLQNLDYNGSTQLGCIDIASMVADMFMIFTDGNNTYGNSKPKSGTALVYAVYTSAKANLSVLNDMVGSTGGKVVNLNNVTISDALILNSKAENWLLNITSASGRIITEQSLPVKLNQLVLINGTMKSGIDTLFFHYGNNNKVSKVEEFIINSENQCNSSALERISMLNSFDKVIHYYYPWESILDFGLNEKVVTPNTAYIVLERIEDYIRYNISAPKDLEEECERLNYVKRDTRQQRLKMKKADEFAVMNGVVSRYNDRLIKSDKEERRITLDPVEFDKQKLANNTEKDDPSKPVNLVNPATDAITGNAPGLMIMGNQSLNEVVVIGYGTAMRKDLTGAVSYLRSQQLMPSNSIEEALQGRVAGLDVVASGTPGSSGVISIRGARSISAAAEPLYILDGTPVSGNINELVSVSDIDNITILKDAASAAIYGSRGANGAIVITTKRGKYRTVYSNKPYRLKDMEDENYLVEIKSALKAEKHVVYEQLRAQYENDPSFYFDMAQHFFEVGLQQQAKEILMNAAEVSDGSYYALRAMAYTFENWKQFDEAISIYQQLMIDHPNDFYLYRDLGLAYYQKGEYQKAIDIIYSAIKTDLQQQEWAMISLKAMMLTELNAIIAEHKDVVDISGIPAAVIRPIPADLRIVLDCNYGTLSGVSIKEPGGEICSYRKNVTSNGGMINEGMNGYSYNEPTEYQIRNAKSGKYRISLNYYGYYYAQNTPCFIRVMTFRNFGKPNPSIHIENINMQNQAGEVEIGEVRW